MKKMIRMLACVLALLIALCGASLAEEKDTAGLLATVNGADVPIIEALAEYEYYKEMYTMYGMTHQLEALKEQIADYYIKLELIYEQFELLGMEADMEAVAAQAQAEYESVIESYTAYVSKDGLTEPQIREVAEEMLIQDGYDIAYFNRFFFNNMRLAAVYEHYTGGIEATEEDVRAYYDDLVASDRELYEGNFAYYEQAENYGERIMYIPEGIRRVKHILVLLGAEDQAAMPGLEAELASVEAALAAEGADTEKLTAEKAELEAQINAIYATIEPKAQEILDKLTAGEDFIALLEEYGEDPGMKSEPYVTEGYSVHADSAQWVTAFRDGAMALEKPGDVSQPIRTSYGLHIIRYESDVVPGPVDFDMVREELHAEVYEEKTSAYYDELINQWVEAAEITVYLENFDAMTGE